MTALPSLELAPEQRRQRTLEALTTQLAGLARQKPVLMIFEDAHWTDPTSLEVFGRTVDRIETLPALLIVTFRPEFDAAVDRTAARDKRRAQSAGARENRRHDRRGSSGTRSYRRSDPADIMERTDGIPLFIEEMTKAVLEAEGQGDARRRRRGSIPGLGRPRKLARLADGAARPARPGQGGGADRSGDRARVCPCPAGCRGTQAGGGVGSALDRLIAAGLLFRQGVPPHATYLFKHALVQDAAYGTLLREPRRALHARIAETLESQFAEVAENQPELLARHCTEAGLIEKAARLWGRRDSGRWRARHWLKPQNSSHARSTRSRPCPPLPRYVASRSSYRSRS